MDRLRGECDFEIGVYDRLVVVVFRDFGGFRVFGIFGLCFWVWVYLVLQV